MDWRDELNYSDAMELDNKDDIHSHGEWHGRKAERTRILAILEGLLRNAGDFTLDRIMDWNAALDAAIEKIKENHDE